MLKVYVRALPSGRYQARTANKVYGTFDTPEEAFQAYKTAKEKLNNLYHKWSEESKKLTKIEEEIGL